MKRSPKQGRARVQRQNVNRLAIGEHDRMGEDDGDRSEEERMENEDEVDHKGKPK